MKDKLLRKAIIYADEYRELVKLLVKYSNSHSIRYNNYCNQIKKLEYQLAKYKDEKSDIINCICLFDDTATIEEKGRYFEVIQRDLRKLINS
jgi:hypothetical protein